MSASIKDNPIIAEIDRLNSHGRAAADADRLTEPVADLHLRAALATTIRYGSRCSTHVLLGLNLPLLASVVLRRAASHRVSPTGNGSVTLFVPLNLAAVIV